MTQEFHFGTLTSKPLDFIALQRMADTDPIGLLNRCRKRHRAIRKGVRSLNWQVWVACYAGALNIRKHPERFADLLRHEFFKQRTYASNIDDVLRLALIIGIDADSNGTTYKRACYIASRLQPFFDQAVEPECVLVAIDVAGGLKRLFGDDEAFDGEERKPDQGASEAEGTQVPGPIEISPLKNIRPNGRPGSVKLERQPPHQGKNFGRKISPDRKSEFAPASNQFASDHDNETILEIIVSEDMLHEVLNSPIGSRARLIVEHVPSGREWKRIEATSAKFID